MGIGKATAGGTGTNFELDEETKRRNAAVQQAADATFNGPAGGQIRDAVASRAIQRNNLDQQAREAGVNTSDQERSAGGIAGFFGAKETGSQFTAQGVEDTTTDPNRQAVNDRIGAIAARPQAAMQAASSQAAQLDASQSDQTRGRQMSLADSLAASAAGRGPSAAQSQLNLATDRNMKQALSLALSARGGNQIAALKQAQDTRAELGQQAGQQAATLRAQEQQQARGQLAEVLNTSRGQDLGAATTNAQMQQQTSLANASNQQTAGAANLSATLQQSQQQDAQIAQLMGMGMSLDQARIQAQTQQNQFNADLLARQEAAKNGVAMQSQAQGAQLAGATIGAIGAAVASDKRAKKNIEDGDEPTAKLLKSLRPKAFDYKEPEKFGEGRHLGVMAQDVEKAAPDMVVDDTDGVKKLDMRKALSASLAALGHMDKRLAKVEGKRG